MNIPKKIRTNKYIYLFVRKINDRLYMYEEEKHGWKECFHITDLIKLESAKKQRIPNHYQVRKRG